MCRTAKDFCFKDRPSEAGGLQSDTLVNHFSSGSPMCGGAPQFQLTAYFASHTALHCISVVGSVVPQGSPANIKIDICSCDCHHVEGGALVEDAVHVSAQSDYPRKADFN